MISHLLTRLRRILLIIGLIGGIGSAPVLAQYPGGPPPEMRQGWFGPDGRPPGPGGPPPGGPPVTPANLPLNALASDLRLTAAQQAKIGQIQQQFQKERRAAMPAPGERPQGPPDRDRMEQSREKVMQMDRSATGAILSLLTTPQKQALPGLLKAIDAARSVGIPPPLYGSLKLSADQKRKIAALADAHRQQRINAPRPDWGEGGMGGPMRPAHEETRQAAMALLTESQKAQITKFQQTHPRPEGFGPPPEDGGPPPPGEGGPPPGGGY